MQDLVAVGIADARHEGLVPEQVLELTGMAANTRAPFVEAQGRIVRVGSGLLVGQPRHPTIAACRHEVNLAHLGRVAIAHLG